jgi:Mannosyltransferase (PIG-V)
VFLVATATVFGNSTGSLPPIGEVNLPALYGLARWDSGYYLGIATDGYAVFQHGYSFRPLFPLVIRVLYPAFPRLDVRSAEVLAGFLWNLLAVGVAAFYLERLTKQLLGPRDCK